jgi:hypothetical protein
VRTIMQLIVVIAALAVLALGCGDDDTDDAAPAGDPTPAAAGDLEAWCLGWNSPPIVVEGDDPTDADRQGLPAILAREEALAAVAPPEIVDASQAILDDIRETIAILEPVDFDPSRLDAADAEALEALSDPEAAAEHLEIIDRFAAENCS